MASFRRAPQLGDRRQLDLARGDPGHRLIDRGNPHRRRAIGLSDDALTLENATRVARKYVRITHRPSGDLIAAGPVGWGITPFEGNWYISPRHLRSEGFHTTAMPGLCPYKFIYLWLDFRASTDAVSRALGWRYVLPNPLLPFIAFCVAVPGHHPELEVEVKNRASDEPEKG